MAEHLAAGALLMLAFFAEVVFLAGVALSTRGQKKRGDTWR